MVTTHQFTPERYYTAIGAWEPALHIQSGDTVVTSTVDSGGMDKDRNQATEREAACGLVAEPYRDACRYGARLTSVPPR